MVELSLTISCGDVPAVIVSLFAVASDVVDKILSSRFRHFLASFRFEMAYVKSSLLNFAKFIQNVQKAIFSTFSGTPHDSAVDGLFSTKQNQKKMCKRYLKPSDSNNNCCCI